MENSKKSLKPKGNFLKGAGIISAATMLSRVLGLVREQVFAYLFGAGLVTDAFQIAYRIPNLLRDLFAEGAMSAALVPVYIKERANNSEEAAWSLARRLMSVLGVTLIALSILAIYFADHIVGIFPIEPGSEKFELTVGLTRVMIPFLPTVVMAAIWMSILNARKKFSIPALAPSMFNVLSVFAAFAIVPFMPRFGLEPIYGMAIGVLLGGLAQWFLQVPALRYEGFRFRFQFGVRDKKLLQVISLMGVGAVGMAATQVNVMVNSFLALSQGDGAVSWLNYAFRLMQFPIGVFGVAIAQVTLTQVSDATAVKDLASVRDSVVRSLRMAFTLAIPSAVGLIVWGYPIISVIFEHGAFTAEDSYKTTLALAGYAIGLAAYSCNKILVPVLYSLGKARFAVGSSVTTVAVSIALSLWWIDKLSFIGLALATSTGAFVNTTMLLTFVARNAGGFYWRKMFSGLICCSVSAILMGALLWFVWRTIAADYWAQATFFPRFGILSCGLVVGAVTYWGSTRLMGLEETRLMEGFLARRLWKRADENKN